MHMEPEGECIFCGSKTAERHETDIGVIYIHAPCLNDLGRLLALWAEDLAPLEGEEDPPSKK